VCSSDLDRALHLVKPVFFVAVLLEHLNYAFLPQFMYQVVADAGLSEGYASAPFIGYYLCFALALIPAGHFAQHNSTRPLMYMGLLLAGGGLIALSFPVDFYTVLLARSISGVGQGMLFIGVQSYILMMASPGRKTRGAAIIVFGFQGGMISGMAIGSLLVAYMGSSGVFTLSGIIAFGLAIYTMFIVPIAPGVGDATLRVGFTFGQLARNMAQVLRSLEFLKAMFLIGIPAKAVLTGVVIFALPLLLAQREYAQEDIGQIIMVYAAGVVLASSYASRFVDRTGQTYAILFWGTVIAGFGLFLIGLIDWAPLAAGLYGSYTTTLVLLTGVATVGVAHGFVNAPVVTHVADSVLAEQVGASSLTATYRFLERLGHIAGPIIVSQLFLIWGQSALLLTWIGAVIALCGILFLLPSAPGQDKSANRETV
jgi:MFS family permease